MLFNTLWTILLGVIGGVVSSLIVSRVFFIQSEYQLQIKFVEGIIRKMSHISAFLQCAKAILDVSYDQKIKMRKEMKEKGYNTKKEYYVANADIDWIYKDDVLDVFHREITKTVKTINALNGAFVFVDEPEISLHPKWQMKILDYYKNIFTDNNGKQTSQIIAVTHSPFIIHNENRKNDKVIILERDTSGEIVVKDKPEYYKYNSIEVMIRMVFRLILGTFAKYYSPWIIVWEVLKNYGKNI